uniref:Uncharacterized protein n=1 Tax=Oncorhynchus kisutch TaxID=8019 RepID=A0A8C7D0F8_ONCKI
ALGDVSQQGYAQIVALREEQQVLSSLQLNLSLPKGKEAEVELKSNVRQILILEGEMEQLQRHMQDLGLRSVTVYNENTELRLLMKEEEDNFSRVLAGYNTYRNKMEGHRTAVLQVESQTRAHREERGAEDRPGEPRGERCECCTYKKERNAGKNPKLPYLFKTHVCCSQIQNRRYDAIVKRLHCQLMKAQSGHRQLQNNLYWCVSLLSLIILTKTTDQNRRQTHEMET